MIDFELGWRAVPGFFSPEDGDILQRAVHRAPSGTSVIELGAWCGRSLAAACEALPEGVTIYSIDNYKEDSQTIEHAQGLKPDAARCLREIVAYHYRNQGKNIVLSFNDSSDAGKTYRWTPISVLFIDDHHSEEQASKNLDAWVGHLADKAAILFHDYGHKPYGIEDAAQRVLPGCEFVFVGMVSGVGIWTRGD